MSGLEAYKPDHFESVFNLVEDLGFNPADAATNPVLDTFISKLFKAADERTQGQIANEGEQ